MCACVRACVSDWLQIVGTSLYYSSDDYQDGKQQSKHIIYFVIGGLGRVIAVRKL